MKSINLRAVERTAFFLVFIWGLSGWLLILGWRPILKWDYSVASMVEEVRPRVEEAGGAVYSDPYTFLTLNGWKVNSRLVFVGINNEDQQDEIVGIMKSLRTGLNRNTIIILFKNGQYSEESEGSWKEGRVTRKEAVESYYEARVRGEIVE